MRSFNQIVFFPFLRKNDVGKGLQVNWSYSRADKLLIYILSFSTFQRVIFSIPQWCMLLYHQNHSIFGVFFTHSIFLQFYDVFVFITSVMDIFFPRYWINKLNLNMKNLLIHHYSIYSFYSSYIFIGLKHFIFEMYTFPIVVYLW